MTNNPLSLPSPFPHTDTLPFSLPHSLINYLLPLPNFDTVLGVSIFFAVEPVPTLHPFLCVSLLIALMCHVCFLFLCSGVHVYATIVSVNCQQIAFSFLKTQPIAGKTQSIHHCDRLSLTKKKETPADAFS